jgi:U2 small nuclear ribonucleoprotein B''
VLAVMELPPLADIPPNHTVYVNNLNDGLKKQELRTQLYCLFSQYGVILDVVALKTSKMRGQAFVTFRDIGSATQSMRALQGFSFFGKPMRLQYAKAKANVIAQIEGTFDGKRSGKRKVEFGVPKAAAAKKAVSVPAQAVDELPARPTAVDGEAAGADGPTLAASAEAVAQAAAEAAAAAAPEPELPPNKVLFVENLPEQANEMMLRLLFQQFDGFKEARLVPGKVGISFVEFGSEVQSRVAMSALQRFKITPTHLMKISFAKA